MDGAIRRSRAGHYRSNIVRQGRREFLRFGSPKFAARCELDADVVGGASHLLGRTWKYLEVLGLLLAALYRELRFERRGPLIALSWPACREVPPRFDNSETRDHRFPRVRGYSGWRGRCGFCSRKVNSLCGCRERLGRSRRECRARLFLATTA